MASLNYNSLKLLLNNKDYSNKTRDLLKPLNEYLNYKINFIPKNLNDKELIDNIITSISQLNILAKKLNIAPVLESFERKDVHDIMNNYWDYSIKQFKI